MLQNSGVTLLIFTCAQVVQCSLPETVQLGGIFELSDVIHRVAFEYAVRQLDKDDPHTEWKSKVVLLDGPDSLNAYKQTCSLFDQGVSAVFGPSSEPAMSQTQSLCDLKEIPHLMTVMERQLLLPKTYSEYSINLYPKPYDIGQAVADTIRYYDWVSLMVLYEHGGNLLDLQAVMQLSTDINNPMDVKIRKIEGSDFGPLLKEIKNTLKETRMVVHARLDTVNAFMAKAHEFDMLVNYYHYFFTNLDVYTLDLAFSETTTCNMTGLRLIQQTHDELTDITEDLRADSKDYPPPTDANGNAFYLPVANVPTAFAVMLDSVNFVAEGLRKSEIGATRIDCQSNHGWRNGSTFMNMLKLTEINGTTGKVVLDNAGERSNYKLTVIENSRTEGWREYGTWSKKHGLNVTRSYETALQEATETLENKTLRVTVILEEPFVMLKQTEKTLYGNDQFEGYCIDVLEEISKIRKFNYTIHIVKDKAYGSKDTNGNWNGMVGELVRGEADLAVASLTISYSRSEVIDFTVPFMHLGISILFKKPVKKDPGLFTFLSPLSLDVWLYMLVAYVGVSMMLWILARFSPYEWSNPHPVDPETDEVENQFSLGNSFWFTVGSLMQQGSDLTPRAASTRLAACMWWLFTLILISSYTANLAAFLTVERMVSPIESADDLAKQTKIKYGSLGRGSTMSFFNESRIQTYQRMWAYMESTQPSVFVNSSKAGITRVKAGDYAYLMESAMLEYFVERDCELMQIGGLLDSKGYGIGLPKHSKYREPISSAILMLQEKTILAQLKELWWKQRRGGGKCSGQETKAAGHNELGLQNVGGVFVVLAGGMCIAFVIAICEFIHRSRQNAAEDRRPLCTEMCQELQFAMSCHADTKPIRKKSGLQFNNGAAIGKSSSPYLSDPVYDESSSPAEPFMLPPHLQNTSIAPPHSSSNQQQHLIDYHHHQQPPQLYASPFETSAPPHQRGGRFELDSQQPTSLLQRPQINRPLKI